jgi:glycosyltransferase involved in cell wall biosynthesis
LKKRFGLSSDDKIVIYQGYITKGRGIEEIVRSMNGLSDNIKLVILGKGDSYVDSIKDLIEKNYLQHRVFFQNMVPYDELIDWTSSADLGISLIQNVSLSDYYSLPNKMFEYIQAGIPVICSNFPDMKNLVEHYGVGEVSDPNKYEELRAAISLIFEEDDKYERYRQNSLKAKVKLCWENEEEKLLSLVKEL